MKYIAQYKLSRADFDEAMSASKEDNSYYDLYRVRIDNDTRVCGHEQSEDASEFSWLSCQGNFAGLKWLGNDTVELTVDSRRHGIPRLARQFYRVTPKKVIKYQTQEKSWDWYDNTDSIGCM